MEEDDKKKVKEKDNSEQKPRKTREELKATILTSF